MPEMKFVTIQFVPDCTFSGLFDFTSTTTGKSFTSKPMFKVRLKVECDPRSKFVSWLPFVNDCGMNIYDDIEIIGYIDPHPIAVPDKHYIFKVDFINSESKGECEIRHYRWRMWEVSGAALRPLSASGKAKIVIGGAEVDLEQVPDKSRDFYIKVCCKKSEEGCKAECSWL